MDVPFEDSPQPPPSGGDDVAFNTFIGVLVSVCGNVMLLYFLYQRGRDSRTNISIL